MTIVRRPSPFGELVLTLRIPKAESVKPRQIRITPAIEGASSGVAPAQASTNGQTPVAAGTGQGA